MLNRISILLSSLFLLGALTGFSFKAEQSLADKLEGAWLLSNDQSRDAQGQNSTQSIRLFASGYTTTTTFSDEKFIGSIGGPFELAGNQATFTIDYNSAEGAKYVGESLQVTIKFSDSKTLKVMGEYDGKGIDQTWTRLDANEAPLAGAWKFSRRKGKDGEMRVMKPGPRKTIKMITGTRFQWVAMNTETKEFKGTGGGTYTFKDGVYTENIDFFSRDQSRVGASLSFEGKIDGDDWHHSGKSSKGNDIYEIWHRGE